MAYPKFVAEHKKLIHLLDASKRPALRAEARAQATELRKVMKKIKH